MKPRSLIEKQLKRKTNPELVETIIACKKNKNWEKVASLLSYPKRKRAKINLEKIEKEAKEGEIVLIPGKVLSNGNLTKKIKVVSLFFSKASEEKLLNSKIDTKTILEEIKLNPHFKGIKIIK